MNTKFKPFKSKHKFRFGIDLQTSKGCINIRHQILDVMVMSVEGNVVNPNVPIFDELDLLNK